MIFFDMVGLMFLKNKNKEKNKIKLKEFEVDEEGFPVISYKHHQRMKEDAMLINYPVGSEIICKSNENEPYKRGKIINYVAVSKASNLIPQVKFEDTGEVFLVMGIVRHYSKELCDALDKLDNIEQWNVLAEFHKISK